MAADYERVARQPGRARAKINLSLHVRGRRADGYHELESLVAFAGVSDALSFSSHEPDQFTLTVDGVDDLGPVDDNLVIRAAHAAGSTRRGHFRLIKNLPIASGIGGGSADAAAALRLLCGPAALHGGGLGLLGRGDGHRRCFLIADGHSRFHALKDSLSFVLPIIEGSPRAASRRFSGKVNNTLRTKYPARLNCDWK